MMSDMRIQPYQGSYLTPSAEHATVADAMHSGVLYCPADASLTMVARMMATHHIHCVAVEGVMSDSGDPTVWGIVSDLDVVREIDWSTEEPTAGELAHTAPISVRADDRLIEAAKLMSESDVHHLVVVSGPHQRPVGVLSSLDVAGVVAWGRG